MNGETLEEIIGYCFRNRKLLDRALTHRSWIIEQHGEKRAGGDNEQLEFLGDSLLGFVVSDVLYTTHPDLNEGQLTQSKAQIVCASHLHACAVKLGLGRFLFLGRGEERNRGRERRNFLADAVEAIIAAIFLDGGLEPAKNFITRHLIPDIASTSELAALIVLDHKGALQEQAQSRGIPAPRYSVVATSGPQHCKVFTVEARVGRFTSRADGTSKKEASQMAAHLLMQDLNSRGWPLSHEAAVEEDLSEAGPPADPDLSAED